MNATSWRQFLRKYQEMNLCHTLYSCEDEIEYLRSKCVLSKTFGSVFENFVKELNHLYEKVKNFKVLSYYSMLLLIMLLLLTSPSHSPSKRAIALYPCVKSSVSRLGSGPEPDRSEWCAPFSKLMAISESLRFD